MWGLTNSVMCFIHREFYALFSRPETKTAIELVHRYPLIQYASLYPFLLSYDVAIL